MKRSNKRDEPHPEREGWVKRGKDGGNKRRGEQERGEKMR